MALEKYKIFENSNILEIEPTTSTPHIVLDKNNYLLKIDGVAIAEDCNPLFSFLKEKLEKYLNSLKNENFEIHLHFVYINTQATKELIKLLYELEKFKNKLKLIWYYSDEEIADLGTQIGTLVDIKCEKVYKELEQKDYFKNEDQ